MNVYIPSTWFATQWPCDSWFHVPLDSEWQAIYDAGVSLGAWTSSWGDNFSNYLKIPLAWYRNNSKTVGDVDSYGYYWCSSPNTSDSSLAREIIIRTSTIQLNSHYKSYWFSIRPFKDTSVIPTSSWTKLYWTSIESWWIFWNSTDWLISISSDGSTWYTIQDKNLGATTVYNYWDTLTDANCGNLFQWGNNYAFPWTKSSDSITSKSARVDTTGYWPWNYYSSDTWITYSWNWSSVNNKNLRWWTDWNVNVTTMKEVKNIYIGEYGWKPWENTVAYYPLKEDFNDHKWSWTLYNLTNNGWSLTTLSWVQCAYFNLSSIASNSSPSFWWIRTISHWINANSNSENSVIVWTGWSWWVNTTVFSSTLWWWTLPWCSNMYNQWYSTSDNISFNTWYYMVTTIGDGYWKVYLNWVLKGTYSFSVWNWTWIYLSRRWDWITSNSRYDWYLSEVIIEDKARTAQEISDYYNQTKSNYWL